MTIHSSILAWRIPVDRGAWQATAHGVAKSQTCLSDSVPTHNWGDGADSVLGPPSLPLTDIPWEPPSRSHVYTASLLNCNLHVLPTAVGKYHLTENSTALSRSFVFPEPNNQHPSLGLRGSIMLILKKEGK